MRLGTTWGPHALHADRRPARRLAAHTALAPPLTRTDAYSHVLGVKGSQVRILSSRRSGGARWFWVNVQVSGLFRVLFLILFVGP